MKMETPRMFPTKRKKMNRINVKHGNDIFLFKIKNTVLLYEVKKIRSHSNETVPLNMNTYVQYHHKCMKRKNIISFQQKNRRFTMNFLYDRENVYI